MSKKRVKVKIPRKPDELIQLGEDIIAEHTAQGAGSPLNGLDIPAFTARVAAAKTKNQEQKQLRRNAETARDDLLGKKKGQNSTTEGTVLNFIVRSRNMLLGKHKGSEQHLGDFGFEVSQSGQSNGGGAGGGTGTPTTGAISGKVSDGSTMVTISGAHLEVVGTVLSATTNVNGDFTLSGIPQGNHIIRISAPGYQVSEIPVTIGVGASPALNILLNPAV